MADDNKPMKYARYAIGEIVLVMVGILLALQVNNWNETKKQHKLDIEFLKGLKSELVVDTTSLNIKMRSYIDNNISVSKTLKSFDSLNEVNFRQYNNIIGTLMEMEVLTPIGKNVQKNDLKLAEGTLSRIDSKLNKDFLAYLEMTKSNDAIISKLGESLQHISIQYIMPAIDMTRDSVAFNINKEFSKFSSDRLLKNSLVKSINYRNVYINFMEKQLEVALNLIESIDERLQ